MNAGAELHDPRQHGCLDHRQLSCKWHAGLQVVSGPDRRTLTSVVFSFVALKTSARSSRDRPPPSASRFDALRSTMLLFGRAMLPTSSALTTRERNGLAAGEEHLPSLWCPLRNS